jgi:chaperonin cofactor prefoldin
MEETKTKRAYVRKPLQERYDKLMARIQRLEQAATVRIELIDKLRNKAQNLLNKLSKIAPSAVPPVI